MSVPKKMVLIVDNEPAITDALGRILKYMGLQLLIATSVEEALLAVEGAGRPPDLALIDYKLPRIDGLSLCRTLRESFPITRVMMLTGARLEFEPDLLQAIEDQVIDHVMEKPWRIHDLREQVRGQLSTVAR